MASATTEQETKFQTLRRVIDGTDLTKNPLTIVNEQSRFVVATYWWGRGNQNKNVARPCLKWYEDVLKLPLDVFKSAEIRLTYIYYKRRKGGLIGGESRSRENTVEETAAYEQMRAMFKEQEDQNGGLAAVIARHPMFKKMLNKLVSDYLREKGTTQTGTGSMDAMAMDAMAMDAMAMDAMAMDAAAIVNALTSALAELINMNIDKFDRLADMYSAKQSIDDALAKLTDPAETAMSEPEKKAALKELAKRAKVEVSGAFADIQASFRSAYQTQGAAIHKAFPAVFSKVAAPPSVIASLEAIFRFKSSTSFEEMIEQWKVKCAENNCNFIAVEYPEFAKPGGYQLAINAKPMFIRKMLEVAGDRGVLYIDGDMTIERYPAIFDMPDVDYMARGWNVDPRGNEANYLSGEFTFDPYYFETSGGTMFFGNTPEAKQLLDLWSYFSSRPINDGKADDRIISLLVNTKAMLGPLKVLQLPVEYLWLTMWYDDFLPRDAEASSGIFIEHPECLTSEDTAAGSGAASSRQPEFYDNLETVIAMPRSELMMEEVLFDEPKYVDGVRDWLKYMTGIEYIYSGDLDGEAPIYLSTWGSFGRYTQTYRDNMAAYKYPRITASLGSAVKPTFGREQLVVSDQSSVIPHIVHQIWFSREAGSPPAHKTAMMDAVAKAAGCAGWTYKRWTIEDLTAKNFPCVWDLCVAAEKVGGETGQSRWAQIADLCRYELLNRYGGVYLDSNFLVGEGLFRHIEQVNARGKQLVVCNEDAAGLGARGHDGRAFLSNAFAAAVRHHRMFRRLISDELLGAIDIQSRYINRTTGPYYFRAVLDAVGVEGVEVLPTSALYPIQWDGENPCLSTAMDAKGAGTVDVGDGRVLRLNCWKKSYPKALGAYMVGLGGSWSFDHMDEPVA